MAALSPKFTSALAENVYALSTISNRKRALIFLNDEHQGVLSFAEDNLLTAKIGPIGIKISSAFGFVLAMKSGVKGQQKANGQAVILFRGTQSLADWLTNANVMTSSTQSGLSVHDDFHQAFKSMQPQISKLLGSLKNIHTFHCIGHSLGGALATLCANWLKDSRKNTYLYTFGSPRTGLYPFAKDFSTKMNGNIYRVYHKTDPVPVIPTWPYVHVPQPGTDYLLYSSGDFFNAKYHGMDEYCPKVKGHSWSSLPTLTILWTVL
jgi:triacylglycerol lipase